MREKKKKEIHSTPHCHLQTHHKGIPQTTMKGTILLAKFRKDKICLVDIKDMGKSS